MAGFGSPVALLAGFISRQTRAGKKLEGTDGSITCNTPIHGNCFGIMHMNPGMLIKIARVKRYKLIMIIQYRMSYTFFDNNMIQINCQ